MTLSRRGFLRAAAMAPALPLAVTRLPAQPAVSLVISGPPVDGAIYSLAVDLNGVRHAAAIPVNYLGRLNLVVTERGAAIWLDTGARIPLEPT